jgi:hypothetical protein
MAINLQAKQNVDPQNSEYPFGKIRNNDGTNNGTPVNEEVYGDFHQFFAKMFDVSGLSYNNNPDNAYDGFQYYEALVAVITLGINTNSTNQINALWNNVNLVNNWVDTSLTNDHDAEYYLDTFGWVHLMGRIKRNASSDGNNVPIGILPVGFRPSKNEAHVTFAVSPAGYGGSEAVRINIGSDGVISPEAFVVGNVLLLLDQPSDYLSLDGISFKTT